MKGGIPKKTAVWPSGAKAESKEKSPGPVSSSKALSRFISPIGFYRVGIACRKMVY